MTCFIKTNRLCKDCNNEKRRNKYQSDETHRLKLIQCEIEFKHCKMVEKHENDQKFQQSIGECNKICSCCYVVKHKDGFRYNRLKCKDCERDDPLEKFKRNVRTRIYISLKRKKDMHTIEYLGTNSNEYLRWIMYCNEIYDLQNYGKEWHVDHVIPLSRFNLDNKTQQLIAFNWRNTMPLSATENLSKNNKIILPQIEQHLEKLKSYHEKNNIELPETFIDLFAKHLDAGNPLEPLLPLSQGNLEKELG